MTKPYLEGDIARALFDRIADETNEGRKNLIDGLFLLLGGDEKAGYAKLKESLDQYEKLEQILRHLSTSQISAAEKLLTKGKE